MADSHSARTKAFISYSHADEKYLGRLSTHLEYYRRERKLDIWSDKRIPPGAGWEDEIKVAIASAKVAILLVSADFLASKFIARDELPPLLEAAEKDGLVIFQIILSPCAFKQSRLARYQAINSPSDPLIRMSKFRREETWRKLAEQVAATLEPAPPLREETGVSPKTKEQWLNEEDEHNDTKREQTTSDPSPQLSWLKSIQPITQLVGHTNGVTALAFSPDDQILVSGDQRGKVRIWEIAKETSFIPESRLTLLFIPKGRVTDLVFHPAGRTFFTGWNSGEIYLWKCPTGEFITSFYKGSKQALAVSPDGLVLVSAGKADRERSTHFGNTSAKCSLCWDEYPITDQSIRAENYSYVKKLGHYDSEEATPSIAFSPQGRFFATSSSTGTIRTWDIVQEKEGIPLKNKTGSRDSFLNIAIHPEENLIAAIDKEGQCLIWDLSTGIIQNTLIPLSGKITAIAFSPDGYHLAAAHSSGIIGFWGSSSGELLHSIQAHDQSIPALVYNHDGYNLVSGSLDKTIKVWGNHRN